MNADEGLGTLPVGRGLRAGISLARDGDMALSRRSPSAACALFLRSRAIPAASACSLRQVHSRRVVVLDDDTDVEALSRVEADGMVTARPDLFLTITVADCLPIILDDPATGAFALVHSGWRGTGIVLEALRLMNERFGARAADVRVTIGPGIGPCCYTVPEDRARQFAAEFGPGCVVQDSEHHGGAPRLDLRAANVALLERAGAREIAVVPDCTCCTTELGSFRRQGAQAFTLMLAYVGRTAAGGKTA